ncbi:hypothetical protein L208DRAFT_1373942 [Tricholoma matsutake]|nr:hypothetical protein L208DRAFT_1373942 [Tricholoma matsutake 945]
MLTGRVRLLFNICPWYTNYCSEFSSHVRSYGAQISRFSCCASISKYLPSHTDNQLGGVVRGIAALDGILTHLKYSLMGTAGNARVLRQRQGVVNVLAQDKKWFDKVDMRVVQTLVKDGYDAWNLVVVIICVVMAWGW